MTLVLITGLLSCAGLGVFWLLAPHWGLIDRPNARSLHSAPTKVGAGLPVVLAIVAGWLLLPVGWTAAAWWLGGMVAVLSLVGLVDDRYGLPSMPRLLVYAVVVVLTLWQLALPLGWILTVVGALGLLWFINLYNFMDGADGLAGLQALLVALAMLLLCGFGPAPESALMWAIVAIAIVPFLLLNWPPARCFMGDAGSVPLGYLLGLAGLMSAQAAPRLGVAWLILMMPFLVDASVTLVLRLAAGHSPAEPHREHAYQRAVRYAGSPLPVLLGLSVLHLLWQFPLAMTAVQTALFTPILVIFSAIPSLLLLAYLRRSA